MGRRRFAVDDAAFARVTPKSAYVPAHPGRHRLKYDPADVVARYERGESRAAIATRYGCSAAAIWIALRRASVEVRRRTQPSAGPPPAVRKRIATRYARGELLVDLAREYRISPRTARAAIVDAGVAIRPRGFEAGRKLGPRVRAVAA